MVEPTTSVDSGQRNKSNGYARLCTLLHSVENISKCAQVMLAHNHDANRFFAIASIYNSFYFRVSALSGLLLIRSIRTLLLRTVAPNR